MDTGCIPPNCQLFSVHVSSHTTFCGTVNEKIPERKSAECEMGGHGETIKKDCTQNLLDAAPIY